LNGRPAGDDRKPTHRVGSVELHRQVRREQSTIEYKEEGTTSTSFDMCVWNDLDLICRVPGLAHRAAAVKQEMDRLIAHKVCISRCRDDLREVSEWQWDRGRRAL